MANASVLRLRRSPQPGKLQIYQQQNALNLALENFVLSCQQLQTLNMVPRQFLTLYANMAEELRALINSKIIEAMRPIEAEDAKHFQQERLKWEARPYPRMAKKTRR